MLHTIKSKLAKHHTLILKIKLEYDVQPKRILYDGSELEYDETKLEYDRIFKERPLTIRKKL